MKAVLEILSSRGLHERFNFFMLISSNQQVRRHLPIEHPNVIFIHFEVQSTVSTKVGELRVDLGNNPLGGIRYIDQQIIPKQVIHYSSSPFKLLKKFSKPIYNQIKKPMTPPIIKIVEK